MLLFTILLLDSYPSDHMEGDRTGTPCKYFALYWLGSQCEIKKIGAIRNLKVLISLY